MDYYLQSIELFQYKNHFNTVITFNPELNIITGPNGSGKTNILDAIYNLCLTKSAISNQESACIMFEKEFFAIKGTFIKNGEKYLVCNSFKFNEKKIIKVNHSNVEKLKEFVGNFPCVLIQPDDILLIKGGSEERRKFFDSTFAQSNPNYLSELINYQRLLKQRNALLKNFLEKNYQDYDLLETYTQPMIELSNKITQARKKMLVEFELSFNKWYSFLSEDKEKTSIHFESDGLNLDYVEIFKKNTNVDLKVGRTTKGIHTDEYNFFLNNMLVRKIGSQGQQKTFLIALKLAQYDFLKSKLLINPILLLDDIFDKLDEKRSNIILKLVLENNFGQTFITDAKENFYKKNSALNPSKGLLIKIKDGELLN
jgi:DNA replication and repair protein RecF